MAANTKLNKSMADYNARIYAEREALVKEIIEVEPTMDAGMLRNAAAIHGNGNNYLYTVRDTVRMAKHMRHLFSTPTHTHQL